MLIDASNAFNALNRSVARHNIPRVCPAAGRIFLNTYSQDIPLYVQGGDIVWSREGTCQGDPLAMAFYALVTMPLKKQLSIDCPGTGSLWYADDAAAGDKCESLHALWESLAASGPDYGYFPNASKTTLLVNQLSFLLVAVASNLPPWFTALVPSSWKPACCSMPVYGKQTCLKISETWNFCFSSAGCSEDSQ